MIRKCGESTPANSRTTGRRRRDPHEPTHRRSRADDLARGRREEPRDGAPLARCGARSRRLPRRAAREFLLHGQKRGGAARGRGARRGWPRAAGDGRDGERAPALDRRRHAADCSPRRSATRQRLRRVRRERQARGALRQDPPVRRGPARRARRLPRIRKCSAGREGRPGGHASGPARTDRVLRFAFPRAVQATHVGRSRDLQRTRRIHGPDGARALGHAAARAGHREPLLRDCGGPERPARQQPGDLRRHADRRPLGPRPGARAARQPCGHSKARPRGATSDAPEFSRLEASGHGMTDALQVARDRILAPSGLDDRRLEQALDSVLGASVDAGDLYFQLAREEHWALEDGIVKEGSHGIEQGVGVRAMAGERTGFAYSDEVVPSALLEAARAARAIAREGGKGQVQAWHATAAHSLYPPRDPIATLADVDKVALLQELDRRARALDPRVRQVVATLAAVHEIVLIAASDGTLAADVRPLVRMNVSVIVEQNGRREQGYAGTGGRHSLQEFIAGEKPLRLAREAVRQATVNLESVPAPAGPMTVVLGPGWPGVLLHEAVGHGLEGDFNRRGTSAFTGRIGERVASTLCTVVDDGTLPGRRGSLNIDDEGTPTSCTTLIENGVLKGYLQDKLNARLMGAKPTGNGRRESFAHTTLPRMTNTYMLPGPHDPGEIIRSVKRGLYAVNFGGGQVDITSGKFVFSASEAYLIENGKVTAPVKGATLVGNGPDVLTRVSMVGNDLMLDEGIGSCGKDGQTVPVGVGQPTLRIDALTVGGTG